jgi:multiple sugar transport system substrate-binding protein
MFIILMLRMGTEETEHTPEQIYRARSRQDVQLTFTQYWHDDLESGVLDWLIGEFQKQYPLITVKVNDLSYSEMQNSVMNETIFYESDVIAVDPHWLYEPMLHGQLELLNQKASEWTVPLISFMTVLFYHTALLQEAGFDRPPKTQTDFLRYARAITKGDQFATVMALSPENPLGVYTDAFSWIWASGISLINNGTLAMNTRAVINTFDFLNTLYREGLVLPDTFSQTHEQKIAAFVEGKIAMMIASISNIDELRAKMEDSAFGITTIPGADTYIGKPIFGMTSWHLAVAQHSPHKEEARLFISFLSDQAAILATAAHAVPGPLISTRNYHSGTFLYDKAFDIYAGGDAVQEFDSFPRSYELELIVRDELYALFEDSQSPVTTVQLIQQKWEEY